MKIEINEAGEISLDGEVVTYTWARLVLVAGESPRLIIESPVSHDQVTIEAEVEIRHART